MTHPFSPVVVVAPSANTDTPGTPFSGLPRLVTSTSSPEPSGGVMTLDWVTGARLTASSACQSTDEVTSMFLDVSVVLLELLQLPVPPDPLMNSADCLIL